MCKFQENLKLLERQKDRQKNQQKDGQKNGRENRQKDRQTLTIGTFWPWLGIQ